MVANDAQLSLGFGDVIVLDLFGPVTGESTAKDRGFRLSFRCFNFVSCLFLLVHSVARFDVISYVD